MVLLNQSENKLTPKAKITAGKSTREIGIPADLMAVSSEYSPKLPKHIRDANSTESGRDIGTVMKEKYKKSFPNTSKPKSFPTKSAK